MQKFLRTEQLAREEHIMYISGAKVFQLREAQGLPRLALPHTDADFLGFCPGRRAYARAYGQQLDA